MNVRGVVFDRFGQDGIDETNDRRVVVAFQQVGRFLQFLRDLRQVHFVIEPADHLHRIAIALFIGLLQQGVKCLQGDARDIQRHAGEASHFRKTLRCDSGRQTASALSLVMSRIRMP